MSRFATNEIPEPMYKNFVNGLLEGTMEKFRQEIKEKTTEINNDIKEEKIDSRVLLRKMYRLSLVYKKLMEKVKIKEKEAGFCDLV